MTSLLLFVLGGCLGVSQDEFDALYDQDGDGHYTLEGGMGDDCDDQDPDTRPGAPEVCDGEDDDCDGQADEGALTTFHADADGDGHGAETYTLQACDAPDGYVADATDCDDEDPAVHPTEPEACDGKDNDCDGEVDEGVLHTFYGDADGDGFGDAAVLEEACSAPSGFGSDATDCDDTRSDVYPGAPESCDGADQDCDGEADEGVEITFYADTDADGHGDAFSSTLACTAPSGWVEDATDCDDTAPSISPSTVETCNGADDDCDGGVDEDLLSPFYPDTDGDGFGDPATATEGCTAPSGFVTDATDCDDARSDVYPDASETCDAVDQDCDGEADEGVQIPFYADIDADGYGDPLSSTLACTAPTGWITDPTDCDDSRSDVYPGAPETCDAVDQDCDGEADEGVQIPFYADIDADGYGDALSSTLACTAPTGWNTDSSDCDDTRADTWPGASETWYDGTDGDCLGGDDFDADADGAQDLAHGGDDCDDTLSSVFPTAPETWYDGVDQDCDGNDADQDTDGVDQDLDCDDLDPAVHPGATETCDGMDQDCDGTADDGALSTFFADLDGDGFGDPAASSTLACAAPSSFVTDSLDCDDTDPSVNPSATEVCDGADNDCDGTTDEDSAADAATWYADTDADGHGDAGAPAMACAVPVGHVADATDCDDTHGETHPGAAEVCDSVDNNCDGDTDETLPTWYVDADSDGYGTSPSVTTCEPPDGYTLVDGDCDDGDPAAHPGATEIPYDDVDQDCAGGEEFDLDGDGFAGAEGGGTDCDDGRADVYLYALEIPGDGVDQDCDGDDTCDDINQDCWADLVYSVATNGSTVTTDSNVTWGSATGFSAGSRTPLPTSAAVNPAIADLDGDGWADVVFPNSYAEPGDYSIFSYIYWGSSSGLSAGDRTELPTNGAHAVTVADLDDDGWMDLFFCNYQGDSGPHVDSTLYWGDAGEFSTGSTSGLPTYACRDSLAEDLDGDGWLDLVVVNRGADPGDTSVDSTVYWGSSGGFSTSDSLGLPTVGGTAVAAGDLNLDGWIDLIFGNKYGSTSFIYWGSLAGFSPGDRDELPTSGVFDVAVADLDQDGWPDIVFANFLGTETVLYWGSASGFDAGATQSLDTCSGSGVAIADYDHDGWLDLAISSYCASGSADGNPIYWGSPDGFSESVRDVVSNTYLHSIATLAP